MEEEEEEEAQRERERKRPDGNDKQSIMVPEKGGGWRRGGMFILQYVHGKRFPQSRKSYNRFHTHFDPRIVPPTAPLGKKFSISRNKDIQREKAVKKAFLLLSPLRFRYAGH